MKTHWNRWRASVRNWITWHESFMLGLLLAGILLGGYAVIKHWDCNAPGPMPTFDRPGHLDPRFGHFGSYGLGDR